jgi:hypothetical protein
VIIFRLKCSHLNESQRAMLVARLANMVLGDNQYSKGSENLPTLISQPAAAMLGVSDRSLRSAKAVQNLGEPALISAVDAGKLAVSLAAQVVRRRLRAVICDGPARWLSPAGDGHQGNPLSARDAR